MIPRTIYHRTSVQFDIARLQADLEKVSPLLDRQLCLTSRPGAAQPLSDGVGWYEGSETDFTVFNEEFRGTIFEEFYETVPYHLGRVRLMRMPPRSCYSFHQDKEPRLHIAIQTHENAYLLVDDDTGLRSWKIKIPSNGAVYWVNTQRTHTAMNTDANRYRVHLVANVIGQK